VPLDDGHTMFVFIFWKHAKSAQALPQPRFKDGTPIGGTGRGGIKMLPNTTDWLGRWRLAQDEGNDWGMDRDKQRRNEIYSGIDGVHLQDQAITESMGGIVDHSFENLAISDLMVGRTRRRILRAVRAHAEGLVPPGVDNPETYQGARGGDFIGPTSIGWLQAYSDEVRASQNPTGALRIAAE